MAKTLRMLAVLALGMTAAGCLQVETTHVLYLSPDGVMSWAVEQREVRSDADKAAARQSEENEYLTAVNAGTHDIVRALAAIGPDGPVRTRVLRDARPYHVVFDARFNSIERAMYLVFYPYADVTLSSEGDELTLRIAFDPAREPAAAEKSATAALLDGFERYRFVLTDGTFVSAQGFDINGATATFSKAWLTELEAAEESRTLAPLVLTWKR